LPTYDLTCQDCGERFELFFMRLLREEDKLCPVCGSDRIRTGLGGGVLAIASKGSDVSPSCGDRGFG